MPYITYLKSIKPKAVVLNGDINIQTDGAIYCSCLIAWVQRKSHLALLCG